MFIKKGTVPVVCLCLIIQVCLAEPDSEIQTNAIQQQPGRAEVLINSSSLSEEILEQRLLATNELIYGVDHTNTASAAENLAEYYSSNGRYTEAQLLYERSLTIRESFASVDGSNLLRVMVKLAGVYNQVGDFKKALVLYQRVEKTAESQYGTENVITAKSQLFLANAYLTLCDYRAAEPLFESSIIVFDRMLGPENRFSAAVFSGMANMCFSLGDYSKAEPYYQKCLKLCEHILGHDNPETARAQNNLAFLYLRLNDFSKAEPLFLDSLKILETAFGQNHPDVIEPLNNLAGIYYDEKEYGKAEPLLQRCLEIAKASCGLESPRTAKALNNLAEYYQDIGEARNAESLLQQSLSIYTATLHDNHPDTAVVLFNLGGLYCREGDLQKAEPLYKQALKIQNDAFGDDYPDKASDYRFLETLLFDLKKEDEAWSYEKRANEARQRRMNNVFSFTTERQRLAYQNGQSQYDILALFGDASALAEALFRYKGVVLDSILEDKKAAELSKRPEIERIRDALHPEERRLFKMQTELPDSISAAGLKKHRADIEELQTEVDQLQIELARNAAELGRVRRALRITVPEVEAVLPDNAALIEFVRYSHYLGTNHWEARYGVVLLSHTNEPVWVALGNATNIEQSLNKYEKLMRGQERGDSTILKILYSELVDPVVKRLPTHVTTLIISPDAELNFLSFATLVDEQDRFSAERYRIKYVASGRDLVYGRAATNVHPELAVFADAAFDKLPGSPHLTDTNTVKLEMLSADTRDYNGYSLLTLPHTAQEAEFLRSSCSSWHLKPAIFTGIEASEAQVKALHSPHILHLATHGFFLPSTETANETRNLSLDRNAHVVLHNPMQRSGLALAGAELTLEAWKRGEVPDTENDGILMADEVALLDLQNTWLVTLSACDTGIGEARAGEGVLGLRRGFIQAGAQNLLMTLWPASDRWTVDLMKSFYERAMKTGNAPDALADVQSEYLVKLKQEKGLVLAARLAGPFVMTFQGNP